MIKRALVTGAGGFIGAHMVAHLREQGYIVYATDKRYHAYNAGPFVKIHDLRNRADVQKLFAGLQGLEGLEVYHFAAEMGGIGYTGTEFLVPLQDNTRIDLNVFEAAAACGVKKLFYASSACVYPQELQYLGASPLHECDAWPANPELGYGAEKLFAEQVLLEYRKQKQFFGWRAGRFQNCYGTGGCYANGREKAPAAICYKVARALKSGATEITIWGTGEQIRDYVHVQDLIGGVAAIMELPVWRGAAVYNIGTEVATSVLDLARLAMDAADCSLGIRPVEGPTGVACRVANCRRILADTGWSARVGLADGIKELYEWIAQETVV